jgi:hypothetical protein
MDRRAYYESMRAVDALSGSAALQPNLRGKGLKYILPEENEAGVLDDDTCQVGYSARKDGRAGVHRVLRTSGG